MGLFRKSKVTVKPGVMSSVLDPDSGQFVLVAAGQEFDSDSPIVKTYAWAFADDADEAPPRVRGERGRMLSVSVAAPDDSAPDAEARLAAVQREIAELSRPHPVPRSAGDVDVLARTLTANDVRVRALRLTLPSLERAVLVDRLASARRHQARAASAFTDAAEELREAERKWNIARADKESAERRHTAAAHQMQRVDARVHDLQGEITKLDERHFVTDGAAFSFGPDEPVAVSGWKS